MATCVCRRCKSEVVNEHYKLSELVYCPLCKEKVDPSGQRFTGDILLAVVARSAFLAFVCGILSAAIEYGTGYSLGIVWIVLGSVVGLRVRQLSQSRPRLLYRLIAVCAIYVGMGVSLAAAVVFYQELHVTAPLAWKLWWEWVLPGPVWMARQQPIMAFIYGFGLFQAWKASGPNYLKFQGPFYLAQEAEEDAAPCTECGVGRGSRLRCLTCGHLTHATRIAELRQQALAQPAQASALLLEAKGLVPADSPEAAELESLLQGLQREKVNPLANVGVWAAAGFKFKSILLGLAKLPTLLTMLVSIWAYAQLWGWPFGVGFVLCIYVHEMGHVLELRRQGMQFDAPLFLPGVGAVVMLRERSVSPLQDARIGLAGPTYGLASVLICWALHAVGGSPLFLDLARTAAWLNLLNLVPLWPFDGGRGIRPLNRNQRTWLLLWCLGAWFLTSSTLLLLLAALCAYHVWRCPPVEGDRDTLLHFAGLIAALAALLPAG